MNLPNIPTDNLYKFLSIFGLILLSLSFYLLTDVSTDVLNAKKELANIEFKYFQDSLVYKSEQDTYRFLLEDLNYEIDSAELGMNFQKDRLREIGLKKDEVRKLGDRAIQSIYEVQRAKNEKEAIDMVYEYIHTLLLLPLFGGLILMLLGFIGWIYFYQRFIDIEVEFRGEEYREKLRALKESRKSNTQTDPNEETTA